MKKITIEIEVPDTTTDYDLTDIKYCAEKIASKDWLASWWHISDVQERAEENGDTLSDEEARDVLAYMDKYHDCEVGINWYSMDVHIDNVVNEREEEESEQ